MPRRGFVDRAGPADLEALMVVERLCSPHPWSEATFASALAGAAGQCVFVVRTPFDRPCVAAFCACAYVADEVHVHNVATLPPWRRGGLAQVLLTVAISVGRRAGAAVAHLEVRSGNVAARALYARLGYRETGTRRDYYACPREDAVLMSLALGTSAHDGAVALAGAAVAPARDRC